MVRQPLAGLAGVGFAVVIVAINAVLVPAGFPLTGAPRAEVAEFFAGHADLVRAASAAAPAAWFLSTMFAAGALAALWGTGPMWALAGFAGVMLQNLTFTGVTATRLALTSVPEPGLWALHDALFVFNGAFLALAMVGLSISGLRAGLIRRWHAAIGLVAAALQFASATLSPLVIGDPGPVGLLGLAGWLIWVVWIAAYGIALRGNTGSA
ncbi:hypothetical protein AB0M02_38960 [Actinoplanes sp. NPDC051861]|uniref:hypothetical protein n=1 Tax=Actinoplanes sp. NPDC051861 TaxID=3155170 RepID=UPI0034481D1B